MKKFFLLAFALLVTALSAQATNYGGALGLGNTWTFNVEGRILMISADTIPEPNHVYRYQKSDPEFPKALATHGQKDIAIAQMPWTPYIDQIETIYINGRIRYISPKAFEGCYKVKIVDIGDESTIPYPITIGDYAFADCWSLEKFEFERVEYLGQLSFWWTAIKQAYLPYVQTIRYCPFGDCWNMQRPANGKHNEPSVIFRANVPTTNVPYCTLAEEMEDGKEFIIMVRDYMKSQWAANNIIQLRTGHKFVYGELPLEDESAWSALVGSRATPWWYVDGTRLIVDCDGLQMPGFSENGCDWNGYKTTLQEAYIYNCLSIIPQNAFRGFTALRKVVLENRIETIDDNAFRGCSSLQDINLQNVKYIHQNAFNSCALTSIQLDRCQTIGEGAFRYCNLASIDFSDEITSIGTYAFFGGIEDNAHIYISRLSPPTTDASAFDQVNKSTVTLHISEEQGNAYNVAPWNAFNRTAVGTKLYGVYSGSTLTIYYDGSMVARGGYENWNSYPQNSSKTNVTKVIFDASVDKYRPESTAMWFAGFENLTTIQNFQYLHTDNTTEMYEMFNRCKKLTSIDLSHLNTGKVTDMRSMFSQCEALTTIDINSLNTRGRLEDARFMFYKCKNLESIYCDADWTQWSSLIYSQDMLYGCTKLKGGKGTAYDANHTDEAYARPDGGSDAPGYFWREGDDGMSHDIIIEKPELCEVTGIGDVFEDVVHSQIDITQFSSAGMLSFAFFTNDSMFIDIDGTGDLMADFQDGTVIMVTIQPQSLTNMEGMFNLGDGSGVLTVVDGEITGSLTCTSGSAIMEINDEETAYNMIINMTLSDNTSMQGIISDICADEIVAATKRTINVSGGYGEVYDINEHERICDGYDYLCRESYYREKAGTDLMLDIRNIEDGWIFDHWMIDGEDAGASLPLMYTVGDANVSIMACYHQTPTYYSVMVGSEHGTVYDENGTPLESYMGDPCFFADGPLSLNVTDIDEGWEFDYWLVDNQNVGSALPYTFTPNHDLTVVTAIYKQTSSGGQLEETYVCDFTTTATKHTGYTDKWTYDGEWNVFGGQNNGGGWNYVKMGAKSANLANANPVYIANKNAFSKEVKAVKVYYANGSFTKGAQMGVNEWGVKVYSDAAYTNLLYTIPSTETISGSEETLTVYPAEGQTWSAGTYIQVYWDLTNTSSTNGVLNIDKVAYLTQADGSSTDIESVTGTPSPVTQKIIRDGQLFIIRDGKTYNAQGARVQ